MSVREKPLFVYREIRHNRTSVVSLASVSLLAGVVSEASRRTEQRTPLTVSWRGSEGVAWRLSVCSCSLRPTLFLEYRIATVRESNCLIAATAHSRCCIFGWFSSTDLFNSNSVAFLVFVEFSSFLLVVKLMGLYFWNLEMKIDTVLHLTNDYTVQYSN